MESLDRVWQALIALATFFGGLFMYRKRSNDEHKKNVEDRLHKIELEQARHGVTVLSIHERILNTDKNIENIREAQDELDKVIRQILLKD